MERQKADGSVLQGCHLLLEGLGLRHHPVYQILQSYQHHPDLQLGQGVHLERSQWHTHTDHDHLGQIFHQIVSNTTNVRCHMNLASNEHHE